MSLNASNDRPVTFEQLPQKAQQFIKQHFPDLQISIAKQDMDLTDKNYDVIFVNGDKIEFTSNGEWTSIDCKYGNVPESAVPSQILNYVKTYHKDLAIITIEKNRRNYEVKLKNKIELIFDLKYNFVKYDD
jgi:hypothetical protein